VYILLQLKNCWSESRDASDSPSLSWGGQSLTAQASPKDCIQTAVPADSVKRAAAEPCAMCTHMQAHTGALAHWDTLPCAHMHAHTCVWTHTRHRLCPWTREFLQGTWFMHTESNFRGLTGHWQQVPLSSGHIENIWLNILLRMKVLFLWTFYSIADVCRMSEPCLSDCWDLPHLVGNCLCPSPLINYCLGTTSFFLWVSTGF
jgi:hypothetical protein